MNPQVIHVHPKLHHNRSGQKISTNSFSTWHCVQLYCPTWHGRYHHYRETIPYGPAAQLAKVRHSSLTETLIMNRTAIRVIKIYEYTCTPLSRRINHRCCWLCKYSGQNVSSVYRMLDVRIRVVTEMESSRSFAYYLSLVNAISYNKRRNTQRHSVTVS